MTKRRAVGRPTSVKPASAKTLGCRRGALPETALAGLVDHRVALEGPRAALARELDRGAGERRPIAAAAETGAGDEAGHRPDAVVGRPPPAVPGDALEQSRG